MGFGSFMKKISNPMNAIDPAGSAVRAATGNNTITGRSMLDPSGKLLVKQDQGPAPTARTPYMSRLSPAAQALKDQMAARRTARTSGMTPAVTPRSGGGMFGSLITRAMQGGVGQSPQQQQPLPQQMQPQRPPMPYHVGNPDQQAMMGFADGGRVKKGAAKKGNSSSKVFNRKPNGKPF